MQRINMTKLEEEGLVPACGGTETPFTYNGVEWIYCWHKQSNQRLYYNMTDSRPVWNLQFHPVAEPHLEFIVQLDSACKAVGIDNAYF